MIGQILTSSKNVYLFVFPSLVGIILPYALGTPTTWLQDENAPTNIQSSKPHEFCNKFEKLATGVCKNQDYNDHVLPNPNLTIWASLRSQNIHSLDDKTNSYSMDMEIVLFWIDPGIKSTFSDSDKFKGYIPLSIRATKKMWTPDIHIFNLSDFKTFEDSLHVSSVKMLYTWPYLPINTRDGSFVEYKISFKASVYCKFDFQGYPSDKSLCRFIFGSHYDNIRYIFLDEDLGNNHTITGLHDCKLAMTNGSILENLSFKNNIGLDITISRLMRPFIYRYLIPCIGFAALSSISMFIPINSVQPRVGLSVTLLLTTLNLYLNQLVRTLFIFNFSLYNRLVFDLQLHYRIIL